MGFEIENGVLKKYKEEPGVTEAVIPDSVTSIGKWAFYGCSSLTAVTIPGSVTSIGEAAFAWCKTLPAITIPASVTEIGESAFYGCTSLSSLTIPSSVTHIGEEAFSGCSGLSDQRGFVVIRGVLYGYFGVEREITLPDSVTRIETAAFENNKNLTAVTIPDRVTNIGWETFLGCANLKKLRMFGYTIDATQWNWKKVQPSDIVSMLKRKDYAVKMDRPIKYQFVAQVFLKDSQPEAQAYIKKNISQILPYFIGINDYGTVRGLLFSGKFVTKENILSFIDHAISHTQNGGDLQIQVLLMNYKNDHFPDMDPMRGFKF